MKDGVEKKPEKKRENSASVKEFWMVQVVYVKRSTVAKSESRDTATFLKVNHDPDMYEV